MALRLDPWIIEVFRRAVEKKRGVGSITSPALMPRPLTAAEGEEEIRKLAENAAKPRVRKTGK